MFLLEEAGPLELDPFEGASSVKLARHFWVFLQKKLPEVPAVGLE